MEMAAVSGKRVREEAEVAEEIAVKETSSTLNNDEAEPLQKRVKSVNDDKTEEEVTEEDGGSNNKRISAVEAEVGISVLLGTSAPWIGIVKHRFTDFQVSEVSLDGQVVHLTDITSVPVDTSLHPSSSTKENEKDEKNDKIEEEKMEEEKKDKGEEDEERQKKKMEEEEMKKKKEEEARATLTQILGEEQTATVLAFIQQVITEQDERIKGGSSSSSSSSSRGRGRRGGRGRGGRRVGGDEGGGIVEYKELKLAPCEDKMRRTEIHKAFRTHYEGFLDTKTQDESVVVMVVGRPASSAGGRGRRAFDLANPAPHFKRWPECFGDYIRFVLYKENKDTTAAVTLLAKFLNTRPSRFTYAGTKDKRGVTTQHMTAYHLRAEQLRGLNARLYGLRLGNFSYVPQPLRLGDLLGNRFSIVLREVSASEEVITESLNELNHTGFINYYGLQRFGTGSIATHRVGVALLQGQWREAIQLILQPRRGEDHECEAARKIYAETGDIVGALRRLPRQLHVERLLLQGLQKVGTTQYLGAFQTLPRNLRMLYAHSYQSYVWNCMATERVRLYGADKPVIGDLVLINNSVVSTNSNNSVTNSEPMDDTPSTEPSPEEGNNEVVEEGEEGEVETDVEKNDKNASVKVLMTEADVAQYTIDDVVLPLPGHQAKLPDNQVGQAYLALLAQQGLSLSSFSHKVKDFRLPGGYRRLLARPVDLEWEFLYCDEPTADLQLTDLDKLQGKSSLPHSDKKHRAVRVSFTLGSSSYATMLLRQLMKQESSIDVQKRLYTSQRAAAQ